MAYALLADLVASLHLGFVVFVVFGGLLALKWRTVMWWHLSATAWAALVEFAGWTCPLTPIENWLRDQAGLRGYQTDFIAHYLLPVLYPEQLTRDVQILLGALVVAINAAFYSWLYHRSS